jgi:hypothetical protein
MFNHQIKSTTLFKKSNNQFKTSSNYLGNTLASLKAAAQPMQSMGLIHTRRNFPKAFLWKQKRLSIAEQSFFSQSFLRDLANQKVCEASRSFASQGA